MRSFEEEVALVGKRVLLWTSKKERQLGLATYLWNGEFLLDTGKKIREEHCWSMLAPPSKVPPFEITLRTDTRVFEGVSCLLNTGYYLHKDAKIRICSIEVKPWNHGGYVAGKFFYRGEPYWFVMSEVDLPVESHLRLVG